MKIKSLIASVMLVFALGATTALAANDATLEPISYTSGSGSLNVVISTTTITELDQYSQVEIHYDNTVFEFDEDNSTTQTGCYFNSNDPEMVAWIAEQDPTTISTSAPLGTLVFKVKEGQEANVEGTTFTLKNAELTKDYWDVEFTAEEQVQAVTVVGGGNTVTATKGETAGDDVTAYTVSSLSGKKVMTKTFEGLTITDATRVYVTIDGVDRVFGSDLADATDGLTIGKLTFGIIVDENVAASDVTNFEVE